MTPESAPPIHQTPSAPDLRWQSYLIERGGSGSNFRTFWGSRTSPRNGRALLIAGLGFDPRMSHPLEALTESRPAGSIDVRLIQFDEGPDSASRRYAPAVSANLEAVKGLVGAAGAGLQTVSVPMTGDSRRAAGVRVGDAVAAPGLRDYGDIIVDISALPRTLYFPLIRYLLQLSHGGADATVANLHVVLLESPDLDGRIIEELAERADYLPGFAGGVDLQQDEDVPRVWAPVLGEHQSEALRRIEQKIRAADNAPEICPVLPFPAADPRRGDRLLLEYATLFRSWRVDLRNIIYASEHNPFDVYRQLCRLHDQYSVALRPLRGAKVIVSAHSSKLLSLGTLLASCDRREIAVAHVEAHGYQVDGPLAVGADAELCEIWIAGEPYEVPVVAAA